MSKINFLTVFFSFFILQSFAQPWQFGIKAHGGYSRLITDKTHSGNTEIQSPYLSGNFGFWGEQRISEHSSWGLEMLWIPVIDRFYGGYYKIERDDNYDLVVTGKFTTIRQSQTNYFALPAYYRYHRGKWGCRAGTQIMFPLFTSRKHETAGTYYNEPYFEKGSLGKSMDFDNIQLGPKIGISYLLHKRLTLTLDYYAGIIHYNIDRNPQFTRVRQMSMGLAYAIITKKPE